MVLGSVNLIFDRSYCKKWIHRSFSENLESVTEANVKNMVMLFIN